MSIHFNIHKKLDYFDLEAVYSMSQELLVIEGASGAGKTTILNCLSGILPPDKGEITIDGKLLFSHTKKINVPVEKRSIGYLFQNYALFPHMTVRENILYGLKNKREYRLKALRNDLLCYAMDMMKTLGIAHLSEKHPSHISGGEKQRTALARAMVTKPSLLLLDEPFSALDENTRESVYEEFAGFKETFRIPTILITHNHRETELFADKHIILQKGRIINDERSSC